MGGYREFHYEKTYAAPDVNLLNEGLQQGAQNVSRMFDAMAANYNKRKTAEQQYQYSMEYGNFETDNKFNEEYAKHVTELGKSDIRKYGILSQDTREKMMQGQRYVADQQAQYKQWIQNDKDIKDRVSADDYYDPYFDGQANKVAAFGEKGDRDFRTRKDELIKVAGSIGMDPRSFKFDQYTADWVKMQGEKSKEISNANPAAKSAETYSSPFWDPLTSKPGVTDNDAIRFLNSDKKGRVDQHYNFLINSQLDQEIEQMKASGDSKHDWMEGLSNAEIKNELINNPSKNTINSNNFGTRKRDAVKADLTSAANIKSKVDYESKIDKSKTKGLYNNDKITYGEFTQLENVGTDVNSNVADAHRMASNYTVGANLSISTGATIKSVYVPSASLQQVYDIKSGKSMQNIGGGALNLTGYQVGVWKKDGSFYPIQANNFDEYIKAIQSIPDYELKNLDPNMSINFRGYTINKGSVLGEVAKNRHDLEEQLGAAYRSDDKEKIASLQTQINNMSIAVTAMNSSSDSFGDDDLVSSLRMLGINATQFQNNVIMKAADSDLSFLNSVTQGLDLRRSDKRSREMNKVMDAYANRYNEVAGKGFGESPSEEFNKAIKKPAKKTTTDKPTETVKVSSQADVDKLKPGTKFIWTDGQEYTKD